MKKLSILIILLIISNFSFAQQPKKAPSSEANTKSTVVLLAKDTIKQAVNDSDEVFVFVENQPEFPGGDAARIKYLQTNINYPELAKEQGLQGTVYISFVVEKDGRITNVRLLRGVGKSLDDEAVRVIKNMPKWKPGTQRGKAVRVQFNMPIRFVLEGGGSKTLTKKEKKALKKKEKAEAKARKKSKVGIVK